MTPSNIASLDANIIAYLAPDQALAQSLIQPLWSGYGQLLRLSYRHQMQPRSAILKSIAAPARSSGDHPRGWGGDQAHQRKLNSYAVEFYWYQHYAAGFAQRSPMPIHLAQSSDHARRWLLLSDLQSSGYRPMSSIVDSQVRAVLHWLAQFHAQSMGMATEGLWARGNYWHLATRSEEFKAIKNRPLKAAAPLIDARLEAASARCLIHGDAKLANFCFADDGRVSAVDFQYVGGGVGVEDVAYFLGSVVDDAQLETQSKMYIDAYFEYLTHALESRFSRNDISAICSCWRELYPYAVADFERFMQGWMPGHYKCNAYSRSVTQALLADLGV